MTPAGVSDAQFARALARFADVVGAEFVFSSREDVDLYRDAYSPLWGQPDERLASAAVAPASVEEVQAVVRIANELRIPLYPISTGKNLGYGGSAPAYSGSVVLDLKRMNRVLEVDEANATVLVEPGVSYFDLYRHLRETGSRLWLDVPDPGWGSLIGNALDRGSGATMAHLRNHFDAHCGLEVVLPDGDLLRTGMGALPGAKTWQSYRSGYGASVDGLFAQSGMGVVTKMGFWLLPEPEAFRRCAVNAWRFEDLHRMVEILNYVENTRLTTGFPELTSPLNGQRTIAAFMEANEHGAPPRDLEHAELLAAAEGGYSPELEAYGRRAGLPTWSFHLSYYGPPEVVEAQWRATRRLFSEIQGTSFEDGEIIRMPLAERDRGKVHDADLGIPSLRIFSAGARSALVPTPSYGHLFLSPVIPRTGAAIVEANRVFREAGIALDLPILRNFQLPTCYWERTFLFLIGMGVTRDPAVDGKRIAAFKALIRIAAEHGWSEYRTAPVFQDAVLDVFSYNDHALRRVQERLKDALDPNGILSAGRYGVWPRHLREGRG
jgi:4-cresol dehydrogenase (hydroxylating)